LSNKLRLTTWALLTVLFAFLNRAEEPPAKLSLIYPFGKTPLRSAPSDSAEVVLKLPNETILTPIGGETNGWINVAPPENLTYWVYSGLVQSNLVVVHKAQVRSGASVQHSLLYTLTNREPIEVIQDFGEWLQIAAPSNLSFWVAKKHVACDTDTEIKTGIVSEIPAALASIPLQPDTLQGATTNLYGRLDWSAQIRNANPVSFEIIGNEQQPLCQVVANATEYEQFVGERVQIEGTVWYLLHDPLPLLATINLFPITPEYDTIKVPFEEVLP
jgi:hypothetical protein